MFQHLFIRFSFFFLLSIRLFYIFSFPLEFGGDGSIYYTMILERHSSLLMAGGYPFLMMWPYHILKTVTSWFVKIPQDLAFTPWWQTSEIRNELIGASPIPDFSWAGFFQDHLFILFQHAISLWALYLGYKLVRKYFGNTLSLIFLWLYGLSPLSLELPSATRPEWLQGAFVVFWLYVADLARQSDKKLLFYSFLGILGSLTFLIKFNAFPILALFFFSLLILERETLLKSFVKIGACFLAAVCTLFLYVNLYHEPTTGTSHLTMNRWILGCKYFRFIPNHVLSKDLGFHTKLLLSLYRDLPKTKYTEKSFNPALFFRQIDVNKEERASYQNRSLWKLNATQQQLDQDLILHGSPFLKEHDPTLEIAYYVGLEPYSLLHGNIYWEAIRAYPFSFFLDTVQDFFLGLGEKTNSFTFRPKWEELHAGRYGENHFGYVKFHWPEDRHVCFHLNAALIPGTWFFTKWQKLWPPNYFLFFFASIAGILCFKMKNSYESRLSFFLFLILLSFIWFSSSIFSFRLKEFECVRAIVTFLASLGIYQLSLLLQTFYRGKIFDRKMKELSL